MGMHFDTRALAMAHLVKCGFYYIGGEKGLWEQNGVDENGPYTVRGRIHALGPGTKVVMLAMWEVEQIAA